jgi:peptidoglycan/xylan/chitin deacetylase (PgdA/CDA1 family)
VPTCRRAFPRAVLVRPRRRCGAGPWNGSPRSTATQIDRAAQRLHDITGQAPLPLFRAPGGKTSPRLLAAARACGYAHVGWAPAGFLGDELPSDANIPTPRCWTRRCKDIRGGDILMAHLGIWSRQDPWAPAVLEPLIQGLKARGFCFETLRNHPDYKAWIAQHPAPHTHGRRK